MMTTLIIIGLAIISLVFITLSYLGVYIFSKINIDENIKIE